MNKVLSIAIFFLLVVSTASAQQTYTLKEIIKVAQEASPAYKRAETRKENRYWEYRVYKSNFNPQITLNGTLPSFVRGVTPVSLDDGGTNFVEVFQNDARVNLSVEQQIGLTGGSISLNSSVNRFDNFSEDIVRYGGNPIFLAFNQPLFNFNPLKWDKKIEPLRFEESKREYVEEMENISQVASSLFFDLLASQISLQIAQTNLGNNDTIYKIAQGRYDLGKIPENELLQLELNLMNSRQAVAQAKLDLETTQLRLKAYLGFKSVEDIELIVPADVPNFYVDPQKAVAEALNNRQEAIAFKRRMLEAERDVDRARGETGLNLNLNGAIGLSNTEPRLPLIYQQPNSQQTVELGFSIPIIDWGRQKSRVRVAEANYQLTQYTVEQDKVDFEQEVYTQVKRLAVLVDQVAITQKADDISQRRYDISKNRYLIGKISITDLSLALTEKDQAKRDYINSLKNFWQAYYNLRQLTLYDFERNERLYTAENSN